MEIFCLSNPGIIAHMMQQGRATPPVFPHSYRTILNQIEYIIHNSITQLVQFSLGRLSTMSSITQKLRAGWDRINTDNYFNTGIMDDVLQKKKGDLPKNNHFITLQIDGQSPNLF
jgi:hypothetical protein